MKDYRQFELIRTPIITEKSTILSELQKYTFKVLNNSNKNLVKTSIEKIFNVKVKSVNILNVKGKIKRFKGVLGSRSDMKKAIVTLEKGFRIDYGGGIK